MARQTDFDISYCALDLSTFERCWQANQMKQNKFSLNKFLVYFFILTATVAVASTGQAAGNFGAGIIIGSPTGLSFKYDLSKRNSLDAAIAWDDDVDVHVHASYLWNRARLFALDGAAVDGYAGVGARIREHDDHYYRRHLDEEEGTHFGIRVPGGLRYMFRDPAVEIFAEIAAIMDLTPDTDLDIDAGIGVRYFF
jgi:hypothetical protein